MLKKSVNISNFSNVNSDFKYFYNDYSTDKEEINNTNNTWISNQNKIKKSSQQNVPNIKLKKINLTDSKITDNPSQEQSNLDGLNRYKYNKKLLQ